MFEMTTRFPDEEKKLSKKKWQSLFSIGSLVPFHKNSLKLDYDDQLVYFKLKLCWIGLTYILFVQCREPEIFLFCVMVCHRIKYQVSICIFIYSIIYMNATVPLTLPLPLYMHLHMVCVLRLRFCMVRQTSNFLQIIIQRKWKFVSALCLFLVFAMERPFALIITLSHLRLVFQSKTMMCDEKWKKKTRTFKGLMIC